MAISEFTELKQQLEKNTIILAVLQQLQEVLIHRAYLKAEPICFSQEKGILWTEVHIGGLLFLTLHDPNNVLMGLCDVLTLTVMSRLLF